MVKIKINTPKVQSDEALAHITQMLHYMERIGKLRHGVMMPLGADASQMKVGDQLWQPWTPEERAYIRGVRTVFAHARHSVLENGDLRVRDRSPRRHGKPEIYGFQFDKTTTDWEWNAQEFRELSQRLETLVLQRIQCYFHTTVTCQTCGQSVDGRNYLTCGHVKYSEESNGAGISRPKGGTLQITASLGYQDDMKDKFGDTGMKGVITYDGLDKIINDMESIDKIASEEAKKGKPIYEDSSPH